jgi:hypothetical protein
MDAKKLYELGEDLFGKKSSLNSLHQEIAEHFYPERADFTTKRPSGTDFAANLMSSYPVQCRRDLANQFSTMLRPTARPWFHVQRKFSDAEEGETNPVKQKLQDIEETMRRAMYDPDAKFHRATKEADNDFAAFGQCAISIELNKKDMALLYRTWHLRDMAWQENEFGDIGAVFRKWKPTAQTLVRTFRNADQKIKEMAEKSPFDTIEVMHMVVDADMYDDKARGRPRFSIFYDAMNQKILEAVPIHNKHYIIPRWSLVSSVVFGSQYAYSPAVVSALPDARLLQAMTFTLLEAGEKAAQPPMVATLNAVKSDVSTYAGGITWVDSEYDERLGEALRPITQDLRGLPHGLQLAQSTQAMLHKAFYLDTLTLPARGPDMTAYEVGQRIQEYIRNALPIFEPMEMEYNAAICAETFDILMQYGAFGALRDFPREMNGMEIDFRFESPLHDAIDQQKGNKLQESKVLLAEAAAVDPTTVHIIDARVALRDALNGIGIPAKWLRSEADVDGLVKKQEQQQQSMQLLAAMEQGSKAAANMGAAQRDQAAAQAQTGMV